MSTSESEATFAPLGFELTHHVLLSAADSESAFFFVYPNFCASDEENADEEVGDERGRDHSP